MPYVPVANTVLVEIRMEIDNQQVENTLYFNNGSPPNAENMTTLGNNIISWWETNIAPLVTVALTLREVVITDLTTDIGPQVSVAADPFTQGELIGDFLPTSTSLAVSFRTDNRGRSYRGRNYFVGFNESQIAGNEVNPTVVASIQTAYGLFLTTPFQPQWQWVVVSRFSGIDPTTNKPIPRLAGVFTPITTVLITDAIVDVQRRRLPTRGN